MMITLSSDLSCFESFSGRGNNGECTHQFQQQADTVAP